MKGEYILKKEDKAFFCNRSNQNKPGLAFAHYMFQACRPMHMFNGVIVKQNKMNTNLGWRHHHHKYPAETKTKHVHIY